MRKTQLVLSADLLRDLGCLPQGIGLHSEDSTLNLAVESDGKGGLVVKATNKGSERKITSRTENSEDEIDDSSGTEKTKVKSNRWPWILVGVCVTLVILIALYVVFKRHSNEH